MNRKILAKTYNGGQSVAILEDDVLVEYLHQHDDESVRGTVLTGVIKEYQPSLDAYFIDAGTDTNGFLPGKFTDKKLKAGTQLVLQVVKPAVKNKGMTLSTILSIPGEYCVISLNEGKLRVSSRIKDKIEHRRLMEIAEKNMPQDLGIIFRTNSEGVAGDILTRDIKETIMLIKNIVSEQGQAGEIIYRPKGVIDESMRDFRVDEDIAYFNDMDTFSKYFNKIVLPGSVPSIMYYKKDYDMFDFFGITNKIKAATGRKVWLKSGGTLIFDYTEAMCVIDVNSAKNTGAGDFTHTAYKTNMEAAAKIAVQIRLRNIGGIIIIDFIDMSKSNYEELDIIFRKYLLEDHRKMTVGGFTALGNYEITRIRKGRRLEHFDE